MAGTIVADQLQDGAGNSTSMDNAIYGTAKAWVTWNGATTPSIVGSYNVSSVTRTALGYFTVAYTNALSTANYSVSALCDSSSGGSYRVAMTNYGTPPSTTTVSLVFGNTINTTAYDPNLASVIIIK